MTAMIRRGFRPSFLIGALMFAVSTLTPFGATHAARTRDQDRADGKAQNARRQPDADRVPTRSASPQPPSARNREATPPAAQQRSRTRTPAILAEKEPRGGKKDSQPPAQSTHRENPPPPNPKRDTPPSQKRDTPPSQKRDTPPPQKRETPAKVGKSTPANDSDATKARDIRKKPDSDKNQKPSFPKREDRAVGKGQPPTVDRTRIDDVRKRLDRQDRGKGTVVVPPRTPNQPRFSERVKTGELNRIAAGANAQKLRLADQYRLWQQGDVARRLELQKHGPPPKMYHGVVSPAYHQHSFQYRYYGPSFFAGVHWYPHWNPWVKWSWHYHVPRHWDPRPIWCRPVFYAAAPLWIYWATPAWTPLPVVASGTWVDLRPVVLAPQQVDLQLVAVRFVDPGHPEEKTGPRYRVWFRNNSSIPVTQPFNVMLFAGNDARLLANLPQAGVRVAAIQPGEIQSVDIRLPFEVYSMNRDLRGNAAPFAMLHVLVDANRELPETTMANNGTRLAPADILPVDPAAFQLDPVAAQPGGEIVLAGEGFGPQPGRALVVVGGQEIDAEITGWYDLGVRLVLPRMPLAGLTEADVIIIRADGAAANPLKVTISP